jgi:hypothetical protein
LAFEAYQLDFRCLLDRRCGFGHGLCKAAARKTDDRREPFDRHDFVMLMVSIVILVVALCWVAPW